MWARVIGAKRKAHWLVPSGQIGKEDAFQSLCKHTYRWRASNWTTFPPLERCVLCVKALEKVGRG